MNTETISGVSGATIPVTTARREWWGWLGSMIWMFFMMYGYDTFMLSETAYHEGGTFVPFFFMVVFALSLLVFGLRFSRDPDGLSKIARFTTPVAIGITAVFALLPEPFGAVLFILAPVLFAPAMTRRVFGVLHTAGPGKKLTRYISGIAVCVIAYTAWIIIEPPCEIAFLVPALFAVPAWLGVRRAVLLPDSLPETGAFDISKRNIVLLVTALIALYWFDSMNAVIHSNIINIGIDEANVIYLLLGFGLPPIGFLLYGIISDKGQERLGLICGIGIALVGLILALVPTNAQNVMLLPLAITDGLGGTYTEYFILTIPIFFLVGTKRPVLVSALGILVNLVSSAINWMSDYWLNESLAVFDTPLLISTAISAVIFIVLVFFIFERQREQTLAAALYALLHSGQSGTGGVVPTDKSPADGISETIEATNEQPLISAGLTPDEVKIATLINDGLSYRDIYRKLHMTAGDFKQHENAIRYKLDHMRDLDPVISNVIAQYSLTKRETDMLKYLSDNTSTDKIATELYITEGTVRSHTRTLLTKLGIENRQDVAAWLDKRREIKK